MLGFLKKASNIAKKVFLVIAVYAVIITLFSYFFQKDSHQKKSDPIKLARAQMYKNINDPQLNSTKDGKKIISYYRLATCSLVGEACTNNPVDGDKNFDRSFFGTLTRGITLMYSAPPASGVYWAYSGLQNVGFVPKTQAVEGIGFSAIKPLSFIWTKFRDIAFIIIVLVIITIGFMIMFRVKINPQTIISLENALPRIVISLLLITFSFAIAGFMIDIMYVLMALAVTTVGNTVIPGGGIVADAGKQNSLIAGNSGALFGSIFFGNGIYGVGDAIFSILPQFLSVALKTAIIVGFFKLLEHAPFGIGKFITGKLGEGGWGGGLLATLIELGIAVQLAPYISGVVGLVFSIFILLLSGLFVFFRIFFLLLGTYVRVVIYIIFAPVILLLHAIPGRNMAGTWFKHLAMDLLTFPIVAVLILVSAMIVQAGTTDSAFWQPPFLYSINADAISVLVGIGILFIIPDLIRTLRESLGFKPSPIKAGLGVFFGGATGGLGAATGILGQFGSLGHGIRGINDLRGWIQGRRERRRADQGEETT